MWKSKIALFGENPTAQKQHIKLFTVGDDDNTDGWLQKANEAWVFLAELQNVIITDFLNHPIIM